MPYDWNQWNKKEDIVATPGQDYLASMRGEYVDNRGFFGDLASSLYKGATGMVELGENAAELGARGEQQFTALSDLMKKASLYKPDVDTLFNPHTVYNEAMTAVGSGIASKGAVGVAGLIGGPFAALGALGALFGAGTYKQTYDQLKETRPDLSEDELHRVSLTAGAIELGSEAASNAIGFGIGKTFFKAGAKALIDSGVVTAEQLIAKSIASKGAGRIAAEMTIGGSLEGFSEIGANVAEAANMASVGVQQDLANPLGLFIGSLLPGAGMTAIGQTQYSAKVKQLKDGLSSGLQSEDVKTRQATVNVLENRLKQIDPDNAQALGNGLRKAAAEGPVSLEALFEPKAGEDVITNPEKILEENGISTGTSLEDDVYNRVRTGIAPINLKGVGVETQVSKDIQKGLPTTAQQMEKGNTPEALFETYNPALPPATQEAIDQEKAIAERDRLLFEERDMKMARDVENFIPIAQKYVFERNLKEPVASREEGDRYLKALREMKDEKARAAIEKGMAEVEELSNNLASAETLEDRSRLKKEIEKKAKLIDDEINDVAPRATTTVPSAMRTGSPEAILEAKQGGAPETAATTGISPAAAEALQEVKTEDDVQKYLDDSVQKVLKLPASERIAAFTNAVNTLDKVKYSTPIRESIKSIADSIQEEVVGPKIQQYTIGDYKLSYNPSESTGKRVRIESPTGEVKRASTKQEAANAISGNTFSSLKDYEKPQVNFDAQARPPLSGDQTDKIAALLRDKKFISQAKTGVELGDVAVALSYSLQDGAPIDAVSINKAAKAYKKRQEQKRIATASLEDVSTAEGKGGTELGKKMEQGRAEEASVDKQRKEGAGEVRSVTLSEEEKAAIVKRFQEQKAKHSKIAKLEKETTITAKEEKQNVATAVSRDKGISEEDLRETGLADEYEALYSPDMQEFLRSKEFLDISDEDFDSIFDTWQEGGNITATEGLMKFKREFPNGVKRGWLSTVEKVLKYWSVDQAVTDGAFFESKYKTARDLIDVALEQGSDVEKAFATVMADSAKLMEDLKSIPVRVSYDRASSAYFSSDAIEIGKNHLADISNWLHEIEHAGTVKALKSMSREQRIELDTLKRLFARDAERILGRDKMEVVRNSTTSLQFKEATRGKGWTTEQQQVGYALINDAEFLAQPKNSPLVRELMSNIQYKAEGVSTKWTSLWSKVKGFISDLLGYKKGYSTALEGVLRLSRELYDIPVKRRDGSPGVINESLVYTEEERKQTLDERVAEILRNEKEESGLASKAWTYGKEVTAYASKLGEPIMDVLTRYAPRVAAKLSLEESWIRVKTKEYSDQASVFHKWYNGLTKSQRVYIDNGLANREQAAWDMMPKEVKKALSLLKDIEKNAKEVSLLSEDREGLEMYFPRRIKDKGMLFAILNEKDHANLVGELLKDKAEQLGVPVKSLTEADKNQAITDYLEAGRSSSISRPGAARKREVWLVTPRMQPYYQSASEALNGHIYEMTEKIGMRRFIGSSQRKRMVSEMRGIAKKVEVEKDKEKRDALLAKWDYLNLRLQDLETELNDGLTAELREAVGDVPYEVQQRVFSIIRSRLNQRGAHGVVEVTRNVGYAMTMGSILSSITQLGDIPITFYSYGLNKDTVSALGSSLKNIAKVAKSELFGAPKPKDALVESADFTNALREFSSGKTSKFLDSIFKWSGLRFADLIGKEFRMQSALKHYQKAGSKAAFMEKYEPFFGKDTASVFQKIQVGKRDGDVLSVLLHELGEWQPVSLSHQSEIYLGAGNARVFYSLKTFALRSTSAAIREAIVSSKKGGAGKAAKTLASIIAIYALAGASTDELKDLLRGRDVPFSDNIMDSVLAFFLTSNYSMEEGVKKDRVFQSLLEGLLPPVRYADSFVADVWAVVSEDKEYKAKSLSVIPVVGDLVRSRTFGQETYGKMEREGILELVKDNASSGKPARDKKINKAIMEYNRRHPEKVIKDKDIMSAWRRVRKDVASK